MMDLYWCIANQSILQGLPLCRHLSPLCSVCSLTFVFSMAIGPYKAPTFRVCPLPQTYSALCTNSSSCFITLLLHGLILLYELHECVFGDTEVICVLTINDEDHRIGVAEEEIPVLPVPSLPRTVVNKDNLIVAGDVCDLESGGREYFFLVIGYGLEDGSFATVG